MNKLTQKSSISDLTTDFMSILNTQSKTGECDRMVFEVLSQIQDIPGVTWEWDHYGNIYVTKGKSETYPCFASHLDTVHLMRDDFRALYDSEAGVFYAVTSDPERKISDDEFHPKLDRQVGVGGDDKCGIIACIEMLHRRKFVKCVFFLDEESGCKGSSVGKLSFFDDCRFIIQIDRKNPGDIITNGAGTVLCSEEFKSHITELGKHYGYTPTTGANTDVVKLKDRGLKISCVNISAGYHNPHSKEEYIVADQLVNAIRFCNAIADWKQVYEHIPEKKEYTYSSSYGRGYQNPNQGSFSGWRGGQKQLPASGLGVCLECGKKAGSEDRVCVTCVEDYLGVSKKTLVVDGNERKISIDEIPRGSKGVMSPNSMCNFCERTGLQGVEFHRGYCIECGLCNCGQEITRDGSLIAKLCASCVKILDDTQPQFCNCGEELLTSIELQVKSCSRCRMGQDQRMYFNL